MPPWSDEASAKRTARAQAVGPGHTVEKPRLQRAQVHENSLPCPTHPLAPAPYRALASSAMRPQPSEYSRPQWWSPARRQAGPPPQWPPPQRSSPPRRSLPQLQRVSQLLQPSRQQARQPLQHAGQRPLPRRWRLQQQCASRLLQPPRRQWQRPHQHAGQRPPPRRSQPQQQPSPLGRRSLLGSKSSVRVSPPGDRGLDGITVPRHDLHHRRAERFDHARTGERERRQRPLGRDRCGLHPNRLHPLDGLMGVVRRGAAVEAVVLVFIFTDGR